MGEKSSTPIMAEEQVLIIINALTAKYGTVPLPKRLLVLFVYLDCNVHNAHCNQKMDLIRK